MTGRTLFNTAIHGFICLFLLINPQAARTESEGLEEPFLADRNDSPSLLSLDQKAPTSTLRSLISREPKKDSPFEYRGIQFQGKLAPAGSEALINQPLTFTTHGTTRDFHFSYVELSKDWDLSEDFGIKTKIAAEFDQSELLGARLGLNFSVSDHNVFYGNLSYMELEDKNSLQPEQETTSLITSFGMNVYFNKKWNMDTSFQIMQSLDMDPPALQETIKPSYAINTTIRYKGDEGYDLFLSVYNLLDETTSNTLSTTDDSPPAAQQDKVINSWAGISLKF